METYFLLPGDTITTDRQTLNFHKGKPYEISKVFHKNKKPLIFVKDKEGCDVLLEYTDSWAATAATRKLLDHRMLRSRLELGLVKCNAVNFKGWHRQETVYFEFLTNISGMAPGAILIHSFNKERDEEGAKMINVSKTEVSGFDDLVTHFEKILKEKDSYWSYSSFSIGRSVVGDSYQKNLDYINFIIGNNIQPFTQEEEDKLIKSEYDPSHWHILDKTNTLKDNVEITSYLVFDTKTPNDTQKDIIKLVIDTFIASPPSHGATAITKLLLGKSKKVSDKQAGFVGKLDTFKQAELFVIVDSIETLCYHEKAFVSDKKLLMEQTNVEFTARGVDFKIIDEIKEILK